MLFTSVPAVFSSTSSDTSRPGGNSGCFVNGKKETAVVAHIFADATEAPVKPCTPARQGAEAAVSHLGVEGDLGEEEPRVDAHQLPIPVVQMALPETRGETWRIWSNAIGSGRACARQ